ncbi:DUF6624 domain-containing protein [Elusimicrobiota bacterium]
MVVVIAGCSPGIIEYDKNLRVELLLMKEEDQKVRRELGREDHKDAGIEKMARELDEKNTARMKEIVLDNGWPGISLVRQDGSRAAFLLIQHADSDIEFQKKCLRLMRKAAKEEEASWMDVAYLTDMVLMGEGKKQLYGTQFYLGYNDPVPYPIEDEDSVDERRSEIGLPSMQEYKQILKKVYTLYDADGQ